MAYYNPYLWNQYPYYNQNQSYASNVEEMKWVKGETGADAFPMPQGWPPEKPVVLWDSTDKKIFLKSWNNVGMPNPLQELDYTIQEHTNPALLPSNLSGSMDMSNYVTKQDLEELRKEIRNMNKRNNNQGGGNQ